MKKSIECYDKKIKGVESRETISNREFFLFGDVAIMLKCKALERASQV